MLRVPRPLAGAVLRRVGALSLAGRELVVASALLGHGCELAAAPALAGLDDPLPALEEAVAAGILVEQCGGVGARIGFSHLLVQRAVYGDLSPARRCRLHQQAAGLVEWNRALEHRVAAAAGPDDELASDLEAAGREAHRLGRTAQAAAWLAQAAAAGSQPAEADRRLRGLDALEILVACGEVAEAEVLVPRLGAAGQGARRNWLLGALDFLAGRLGGAEERLREAWLTHDQVRDASVGAAAATKLARLCLVAGRIPEAIGWGERAAAASGAPAAVRHRALGMLAIAFSADGRASQGLARLAFLPAAPSEVSQEDTDALVLRGMAKFLAEDLAGAIADLSIGAARLRAGVPLRHASHCLCYLAGAEYRLGSWDDAVAHAELAVSLAQDADRVQDLGFVHSVAAVVPALRGDWELASAHVRLATEAGQPCGDPETITAGAIAKAFLAMARGDLEGVADAAAPARATGKAGPGGLSQGGRRDGPVPAGPCRGRSRPPARAARRRAANRHYRSRRAPGSSRNALARLRSREQIRLTEIEHDVPDIADRQVQLADGVLDLPRSRMVAHQPQGRFESEPRGEQPVHHEVVHARGDAVAVLHQEQIRLRPVACPPGRGIARRPYSRLV